MNRLLASQLGLVLTLAVFAPVAASANVRIVNNSSWNIEYLFLSFSNAADWGQDQLGNQILYSGGNWIDIAAPCAFYDLRLIDEDGDECVVYNRYLCNEGIGITDADLLSCQSQTASYGGAAATCGLGAELVLVLPPLMVWRARRTSRHRAASSTAA